MKLKAVQKTIKWLFYLIFLPLLYIIVSLVLSHITVNNNIISEDKNKEIYLNSNGVHLNIIIPTAELSDTLKKDLHYSAKDKYFSFGWGEENFYLNTPTWNDLTFSNAFKALFLKNTTLIHLSRYKYAEKSWITIPLSKKELRRLNRFIDDSFKKDVNGKKILINHSGYTMNDSFYKAKGSYSCFNTCNSWVNRAFKESGLRACLWTPFDFGLIDKYPQE